MADPAGPKATDHPAVVREETLEVRAEFSGPLPPPGVLQQYGKVFVECPREIVEMAKRQAAHRQEMEKMIVKGNLDREAGGQKMAFALSLAALVGGVYLILHDKNISGLSIVIGDIAALSALFYYAKRKQTAGKKA